jgi:hypothetical protein
LVLVRQIDLAEEDGVPDAAGDEVAYVAEVLIGVEHDRTSRRDILGEKERDGIDPETRDTELEPEAKRA